VVAHAGNQRGEEDEAGGSRVRGQPGLHLKKKKEHRRNLGVGAESLTPPPIEGAPHGLSPRIPVAS
jgi:hypothetical protein